jgi:hypothetical protein
LSRLSKFPVARDSHPTVLRASAICAKNVKSRIRTASVLDGSGLRPDFAIWTSSSHILKEFFSFVFTLGDDPLPWKSDALDKVLESRIEPQIVEGRVEKFEQPHGPSLIGLLQPLEGQVSRHVLTMILSHARAKTPNGGRTALSRCLGGWRRQQATLCPMNLSEVNAVTGLFGFLGGGVLLAVRDKSSETGIVVKCF